MFFAREIGLVPEEMGAGFRLSVRPPLREDGEFQRQTVGSSDFESYLCKWIGDGVGVGQVSGETVFIKYGNMLKVVRGNFPFYRFERLGDDRSLLHFVSSGERTIGFSGDTEEKVVRSNRRDLAEAVGFDAAFCVTGRQVHSAHVAVVTAVDSGRGALDAESRLPDTDALVTSCKGVCLMVLSADCVPVLLYEPERRVVAAVHAGWRGSAAGIVAKTVELMRGRFACRPERIRAGIGPSIGKCCFEVGKEVAGVFEDSFVGTVLPGRSGQKCHVDLWEANRRQLLQSGLVDSHIEIAGMCTVCHPDRFFSYRRDGRAAGRFGAGIMLV